LLCFPGKDTIPADRVFVVDGLPIYIAQEAEALLRGRVIDWSEKAGLVIHENVV
jgi:Fe-S cluster assembly iron-binding protein IscA